MKSFLLSLAAIGLSLVIATDVSARHGRRHRRGGCGCNSSYTNGGGYGYNGGYNTNAYGTYGDANGAGIAAGARVEADANLAPVNTARARVDVRDVDGVRRPNDDARGIIGEERRD